MVEKYKFEIVEANASDLQGYIEGGLQETARVVVTVGSR